MADLGEFVVFPLRAEQVTADCMRTLFAQRRAGNVTLQSVAARGTMPSLTVCLVSIR
ncbi:MAG: hypothetical protein IH604_04890 [Burkholderiales bacterium]|nr:hypothetical protein [Burkholderiales bacterium]